MKMKRIAIRGTLFTFVGAGGVFIGSYYERHKNKVDNFNLKENVLKNYPAFPIFATVSAATAFVPEGKSLAPAPAAGDYVIARTSQIMKYGFPGLDNVRSFDDFVLSYDQRNRVAHWVFEHLTKDALKHNKEINRSKCDFKEDVSIHGFFRSTNQDYKSSGFDRGHLAAAGNHRICQKHVNQTFFLSNIAPQVGVGFNRDAWNNLEKHVRKLARVHKNVYVCTGPLYLPRKETDGKTYVKYQVIGANNVAVPTHFFKVVVMESHKDELEMESYVMPNKAIESNTPLYSFQVPPESIERASGLLFFNRVTRDKLVKINGRKSTYV